MSATTERTCPTCGHGNRQQARFCEACGKALECRCTACGNELRAEAHFCDSCGVPLAGAADGASASERPRVTKATPRDLRANMPKHLVERILGSRRALEGERKQG